ncbi:hypothetical protein BKA57DRAFT_300894 [Linnemannia elongata]|nr:hypothetical protein BKA57DRAFT_300894 [Linnemannia elongata]
MFIWMCIIVQWVMCCCFPFWHSRLIQFNHRCCCTQSINSWFFITLFNHVFAHFFDSIYPIHALPHYCYFILFYFTNSLFHSLFFSISLSKASMVPWCRKSVPRPSS